MQWDDNGHAGFTDGEPWLPVNPNYTEVNVTVAEADDESILHYYRDLCSLRAKNVNREDFQQSSETVSTSAVSGRMRCTCV